MLLVNPSAVRDLLSPMGSSPLGYGTGPGGVDHLFSLRDIPGCLLLLEANSVSGNNNDKVEWADTSGNNRNATAYLVGTKPSLKIAAKNGNNSLYFDGVDDGLYTPTNFPGGAYSVFIATKYIAGSRVLSSAIDGTHNWLCGSYNAPNKAYNGSFLGSGGTSGLWNVNSLLFDGSEASFFVNGSADGTNTQSGDFTGLVLGQGGAGGEVAECEIGIIAVYDKKVSPTDKGLIENYILNLYPPG